MLSPSSCFSASNDKELTVSQGSAALISKFVLRLSLNLSFPCLPIGSSHALLGNPKSISMWQAYLKIALIALPDLFSFPGQVFLVSSLFNMFSSHLKNLMNSWWLAVIKLRWVCVWDLDLEDKSWSDQQSRDFFWMDQLHLGPHWWSSHFAISRVHRDCLCVLWSQELHRCLSSLLLHNWKMTGKFPRRCCETHHNSATWLWDHMWHTDPTWQYRQQEASEQGYPLIC